jgi:hypothetical protein
MFGPELMQAFREFKALWDPDNRQVARSSAPKNHHETWKAVPRSSQFYDEWAGVLHPPS